MTIGRDKRWEFTQFYARASGIQQIAADATVKRRPASADRPILPLYPQTRSQTSTIPTFPQPSLGSSRNRAVRAEPSKREPWRTQSGTRGERLRRRRPQSAVAAEAREGWGKEKARRLPTLPIPCGISTIGLEGLNDRIRNGIGCGPLSLITGHFGDYGDFKS